MATLDRTKSGSNESVSSNFSTTSTKDAYDTLVKNCLSRMDFFIGNTQYVVTGFFNIAPKDLKEGSIRANHAMYVEKDEKGLWRLDKTASAHLDNAIALADKRVESKVKRTKKFIDMTKDEKGKATAQKNIKKYTDKVKITFNEFCKRVHFTPPK